MSASPQHQGSITRLVNTLGKTADSDREALVPRVYAVLRSIAQANSHRAASVPATELVHEAYIKLFGKGPVDWENRAHFFGAAARAMQQILTDLSRREDVRLRHRHVVASGPECGISTVTFENLPMLIAAIAHLEALDPVAAEVLRLRFFAGLSEEQTARAISVPLRTLQRKWKLARGWLLLRMKEQNETPPRH